MRDFAMRGLGATQIVNLIGVVLAVFAFAFGPWLGTRSGLWVLTDLGRFLTSPDRPADVSRQQTIFIILVALTVILIGLAVVFLIQMRTGKRSWTAIEILLAAVALVLLGFLFFKYEAQTAGVLLTVLGCMVAGGGAIGVYYRGLPEEYPERSKALPMIEEAWAGVLAEAEAGNVPFSILELSADRPLRPEAVALIDDELRARDEVFPTQESVFVLLWETDAEEAMIVARHLQEMLADQGYDPSWIGLANFPADGDQIEMLLKRAQQAHGAARALGDRSAIVPFSYPDRGEARELIEKAWKGVLAEATADNVPLAALALATSRSLHPREVTLVDDELRSRDQIFPVRDGLFVMLWNVGLKGALAVAHHIQEILARQMQIESRVGVACFPTDGEEVGTLLERAERALEAAQNSPDQPVLASQEMATAQSEQ